MAIGTAFVRTEFHGANPGTVARHLGRLGRAARRLARLAIFPDYRLPEGSRPSEPPPHT